MTIAFLLALEVVVATWLATRVLRNQVQPSPTLRAAILTAASLLAAMLAVTEPVEVILRGPGAATVWAPTMLKHVGLLGCGVGVLLMGLAQRPSHRARTEFVVWVWFASSAVAVTTLHVLAGGSGKRTSVEYVEWSHSQPLLVVAMLVAYIGGLVASLGFFVVIWPLRISSPAERGVAIMAVGAGFAAGWCVARVEYLRQAVWTSDPPAGADFVITQLLSLASIVLLTAGLVWSTAEADVRAWRSWRRFRRLHARTLAAVPAVRRSSDFRLGFDSWVADRAVEVLDALHQIVRLTGPETGFPPAPDHVGRAEVTTVVAQMGRSYDRGESR
ncbi:hypothetical protein [Dietzia sp. 179-F 9C3 NHS]|uniref:hypothetical protein n=1 Tax=Dietzia sp. 179-F 9C3 NHS TaxID=3374295 RepID=UPI00387A3C08